MLGGKAAQLIFPWQFHSIPFPKVLLHSKIRRVWMQYIQLSNTLCCNAIATAKSTLGNIPIFLFDLHKSPMTLIEDAQDD